VPESAYLLAVGFPRPNRQKTCSEDCPYGIFSAEVVSGYPRKISKKSFSQTYWASADAKSYRVESFIQRAQRMINEKNAQQSSKVPESAHSHSVGFPRANLQKTYSEDCLYGVFSAKVVSGHPRKNSKRSFSQTYPYQRMQRAIELRASYNRLKR
jgi:hypothetical protein